MHTPGTPAESLPSPQFERHFSRLVGLAEWNAQSGGGNAWFEWEPNKRSPGQYRSETWQPSVIYNLRDSNEFTPQPGVSKPEWVSDPAYPRTVHYSRTEMTNNGATALPSKSSAAGQKWEEGFINAPNLDARPATVGRICIRGCSIAYTYGDVALATQTYAERATPDKAEEIVSADNRIGAYSMSRSLLIATDQKVSYEHATGYAQVLAALDPENQRHAAIKNTALGALSRALLNDGRLAFVSSTKTPPTAAAREATFVLDRHGVIDDIWWLGNGITAGCVFTVPGFLPMLHRKLASKESERSMANLQPTNGISYVNSYVTKIINTYAQDNARDCELLGKVKKIIIDKRGNVDIPQLIAVGNGLAQTKNKTAAAGDEHFPRYDVHDTRNVGDALLLILDRSRLPSIEQSVRAEQFAQDMQHVEIIDMLQTGLRAKRSEALRNRLGADPTKSVIKAVTAKSVPEISRAANWYSPGQLCSATQESAARAIWRSLAVVM
ncbi:MAG TPA: hypothetical protein VLF43_01820 [Candidatus Saccharimonadales bacterium]|nr:hypothetical protein [Candidatus Saccharimonadales bacterium]